MKKYNIAEEKLEKMKRIYVDANVLIAAFQGEGTTAQRALEVLDDPEHRFVVSDYLKLEVLPKPTFHKREKEIDFMQLFFDAASENLNTSSKLTECALALASKYDMTPMDALHVGAATVAAVDEFVTLEKPTKPICRVKEIHVLSIHSETNV